MKLRAKLLLVTAALLLSTAPVMAQDDDDVSEDGRFAFGIGAGMVEAGDGTEPYFTANLRIRAGYRPSEDEQQGGVTGFIEPEIGYWTSDFAVPSSLTSTDITDMHLGVNLGGAVRLRMIEYFLGAGIGWHFIDQSISRANASDLETDDGALGVNAQFGFDVRMAEHVSLFGVGRFDLIDVDEELAIEGEQAKAYVGARFRF
jgi:hypothetical protein